ncbi:hypothetical protein P879_11239 [Paragonimus westermani]|uniref:Uncharacterized protein n=1 Tax=Paragonimus westermani TaxID=34504 RepID=A0A8T0D662_9TREM|nr:hypothetical protein P879_11239 [Paragonimus westermani]
MVDESVDLKCLLMQQLELIEALTDHLSTSNLASPTSTGDGTGTYSVSISGECLLSSVPIQTVDLIQEKWEDFDLSDSTVPFGPSS